MEKCFVFRVDYGDAHKWLMEELFEHNNLRQGWGRPNLQLIERNGKVVDKNEWVKRYKADSNKDVEDIGKRYNILARMLEIEKGDYLVIPKMKKPNAFTICRAKERYYFDYDSSNTYDDDFRHVIPITNPREYYYYSCNDTAKLSSKFKAYQAAINHICQDDICEIIKNLYDSPPSDSEETLRKCERVKRRIEETREKIIKDAAEEILNLNPNTFEDIIAECLRNHGYTIIAMRQYDRKGTDVDIVASYNLPYISDVLDYTPILLIQVKKKIGKDSNDIEGVKQLINAGKNYECPLKILINTSDSISEDARKLARDHNIKIIKGLNIIDFIIKTDIRCPEYDYF